jgi:hypothetical protein
VYPCPHCGWTKPATGPAVIGLNDESGDSELRVLICALAFITQTVTAHFSDGIAHLGSKRVEILE